MKRGFISGCVNKKAYQLFFDWFFPYFDLILKLFEMNFQDPGISIVLLRFVSEFVTNSSARMSFDISSPNGVLLFQKVAQLLYSLSELS